jgi:hypothetical protein
VLLARRDPEPPEAVAVHLQLEAADVGEARRPAAVEQVFQPPILRDVAELETSDTRLPSEVVCREHGSALPIASVRGLEPQE